MTMSNTDALRVALVPGNAEYLQERLGSNVYLSSMAGRVAEVRNTMYVGVAATAAFAVTSALTDGGYSLASAGLATVAGVFTTVVAKNLYETTTKFRTWLAVGQADGVARAGM